MHVGLEARVPLLDHTVVEFAWRVPMEYKIRDGEGKRLLKGVLAKHVPPALFERPKMGFSVPVGDWLRGSLRPWAEEYLKTERLGASGYLRPDVVRRTWEAHLSARVDRGWPLWTILMFECWKEINAL